MRKFWKRVLGDKRRGRGEVATPGSDQEEVQAFHGKGYPVPGRRCESRGTICSQSEGTGGTGGDTGRKDELIAIAGFANMFPLIRPGPFMKPFKPSF